MKKNVQLKFMVALAMAVMTFSTMSAKDWYVKPNASGTGASWDDACNVSVIGGTPAGLADGDKVYVSAGIYQRSTSLSITKYVTVMGGYSSALTGTDIPLSRNLAADSTIFEPTSGGTARCIAINATTTPGFYSIVLDGLNIKGFNMATANGGTAISITSSQGDVSIKNSNFINNVSLNANGGAFYMGAVAYNITISFDHCTFTGNQATWSSANGYGGAVFFNNGTTAKTINFTNCLFKNNTAYGRAGAIYGTSVLTMNITDCYFDTNYCTNAADNTSSGGAIYIAGGSSASNTVNMLRSIFVNSSCTAKGAVIWFNTIPKNTLNMTDCSLIGNYAMRKGSARASIDADNFTTNLDVVMNNCVLSNYNNNAAGVRQSKYADLMNLTPLNCSTSSTFTNTILNGTHFGNIRNNTYDAVQPDTLYSKTQGFLDDATINLAISGDLKITNIIVYHKAFTPALLGNFVEQKIFDVKRLLAIPMTLVANVPVGYTLTVDGTDYIGNGMNVNISIPVASTDPVIVLKTNTGISNLNTLHAIVTSSNGIIHVAGIESGYKVSAFNLAGQLLFSKTSASDNLSFKANGFVLVKVSAAGATSSYKLLSK
ncbi:MAG: hypothetical protein WCK78_09070 [Paludibacter sp.]